MYREDFEERYRRWWLGKRCRQAFQVSRQFRLVTRVTFHAPPSGIYGAVELEYDDGSRDMIGGGETSGSTHNYRKDAFKPRKCDVEVESDGNQISD